MMARGQRIDYELLDCTLHKASNAIGYPTTVGGVMVRLHDILPDIEEREVTDACTRLWQLKILNLSLAVIGVFRDYGGKPEDPEFFAGEFWLRPAVLSQPYFRQLSALVEVPETCWRHLDRQP